MERHGTLKGARVLLVGSARQSLAACRDIGAAGADVGIARRSSERDLVSASRWAKRLHLVADPQAMPEAFAEQLIGAVVSGGYDVVFPAGDEYLVPTSALRDQLPARVPLAPHAAIVTILDKVAIGAMAEGAGFEVPRTWSATEEVVSTWEGAAVVKDRSHWNPGSGVASHRAAVRTTDRASLAAAVASMRAAGGRPVIQRIVDGRMLCFGMFRSQAGTPSGRIQQTSDHLWPYPFGTTARATTTTVDEDLAGRAERLLDSLGWIGVVNLQLFRDTAGRYTLIDFNGRFNHSLALAIAAGVHAPRAWTHAALHDRDVVLPDARTGVRLSLLVPDMKRAFRERRGGAVRDVVGTAAFAATAHHTIPDLRDPMPALRYLVDEAPDRARERIAARPAPT